MCDPVSIGLLVAGTAVNSYGQNKQKKALQKAQDQRFLDDSARSQTEFIANMNRDRQAFSAQQENAQRASSRDEDRNKALKLAMASKTEIAKDVGDMEVAKTQRVGDAEASIQKTDEAGLQSVGSGVEGRVSSKHAKGNAEAKTASKGKAMKRAGNMAVLGAFSDIGLDNSKAVVDAGVNASALRSSIDRRRQIDNLLYQAAVNKATVENRVAPDSIRVYDSTSNSGQLISSLGQGLSMYGAAGGNFSGFGSQGPNIPSRYELHTGGR